MQSFYSNIATTITSLVGWIVLYTQPLREFNVEYQLINEGHLTYLPITQHHNIPIPLFSRYVFLQTPADFTFLRKLKYIQAVLQQDDKPVILPDLIIQSLRDRENYKGFIETSNLDPKVRYPKNSKINIISGSYSGLKATFNRQLSNNKAEINLNFFNSKRSVQIGMEQIAACY
jgi:transcription antitermination factor NusG